MTRARAPAGLLACGMRRAALPAALLVVLAPACSAPADHVYDAEIRWTSFGIPHITADDLPSAFYAQGFAFAKDAGCILADQIVKVRSERSRYFGPGAHGENLDSDFVLLHLGIHELATTGFPEQDEQIRLNISSYVAGYNAYVREHRDDMPCADQDWLQEIEPVDLYAHYIELGQLASARALADYIATAQPPGMGIAPGRIPPPLSRIRKPASNGWGIGAERSSSGKGMLLANPHFPWQGELKLWESHLRVPGELDMYGVGLMGVLGSLIGFNEHVAWTHTVSDGQRFTMYALELVPGNPTQYLYDGEPRDMQSESFTIDVLQDDGSVAQQSRTMWRSHYGPILNVPPFGWSADLVLTFRDANDDNEQLIPQFFAMNQADSMAALQKAHEDHMGIPWVNTMATSAEGVAWYADTTPTPNLSQSAIDKWLAAKDSDFLTMALAANDVVLLDGGDSTFEWVEAPGARAPGLVPYAKVPKLERRDFIFNANDSHWLTNPMQPLEGFSPLHGFERTPRTPRTRMNAATLLATGDGSPSGSDGKFTLEELQAAALSNRGMMAELLRDELVERCTGVTDVEYFDQDAGTTKTVDVSAVCEAIAGWDLRLDLGSAGAVAFREFLGEYGRADWFDRGKLFAVAFDPDDPIATPSGLAVPAEGEDDAALAALAGATLRLQAAGIAPTATLGEVQFTKKGDRRIPIHGGGSAEGTTNIVDYDLLMTTHEDPMPRGEVIGDITDLTSEGYVINYGTSFIMTLQYGPDGPDATAFLTYSESSDPSSPHYADQTQRFSDKDWRACLWHDADIEKDTKERLTIAADE